MRCRRARFVETRRCLRRRDRGTDRPAPYRARARDTLARVLRRRLAPLAACTTQGRLLHDHDSTRPRSSSTLGTAQGQADRVNTGKLAWNALGSASPSARPARALLCALRCRTSRPLDLIRSAIYATPSPARALSKAPCGLETRGASSSRSPTTSPGARRGPAPAARRRAALVGGARSRRRCWTKRGDASVPPVTTYGSRGLLAVTTDGRRSSVQVQDRPGGRSSSQAAISPLALDKDGWLSPGD